MDRKRLTTINNTIDIFPPKYMGILSHDEVKRMCDKTLIDNYQILRKCALAVLSCEHISSAQHYFPLDYKDFNINVKALSRGVCISLNNAPASAFVNNTLISGIRENLFAVLRDLIYVNSEIFDPNKIDKQSTTNQIFKILRNARLFTPNLLPNMVVCWGGHNINHVEYEYTKQVGYHLGLRGKEITTGCGYGAMKGSMKGAIVGSFVQRHDKIRLIGITEPNIIASEPPNPMVNKLIIMPDIEKRLEAFVRIGHAVIQFPGGVGSTEELFFMLGILLDERNKNIPLPYIITGPESCKEYIENLDKFIQLTLGNKVKSLYKIIINDAKAVAIHIEKELQQIQEFRVKTQDSFYFNWSLYIDPILQEIFEPTHENMANINLSLRQPKFKIAAQLRKVFSGLVAGNVKNPELIEKNGPYQIYGPANIINPLEELINMFIKQNRIKVSPNNYKPCYQFNIVD